MMPLLPSQLDGDAGHSSVLGDKSPVGALLRADVCAVDDDALVEPKQLFARPDARFSAFELVLAHDRPA